MLIIVGKSNCCTTYLNKQTNNTWFPPRALLELQGRFSCRRNFTKKKIAPSEQVIHKLNLEIYASDRPKVDSVGSANPVAALSRHLYTCITAE